MTADATADQSARMRGAGADAVLTKPFEIEQLLTIVDDTGTGDAVPAPASFGAPEDEVVLDPARIANLRPDPAGRRGARAARPVCRGLRRDLERLASSARADDADAVKRTAHAWKGACAVVGARRLVAQLAVVEDDAHAGRVPDERGVAAIAEAYREAAAAIARELG